MPAPPSESLFTRYVLENPWPIGIVLLLVAAILAWTGAREGIGRRLRFAGLFAVLGLAPILAGMLVQTAGERGRVVVKDLVAMAVAQDLVGVETMFADDAILTFGSPTNAGYGREVIQEAIIAALPKYTVESNSITHLRAYTESSGAATVHLVCMTTVGANPYPNVSQWVVRIERQADDSWKITRLTCVAVNDRTPSIDWFR